MESRSSESSYGFGGYSSESSYASESRNSYRPSSYSSESALESRSSSNFSSESKQTSLGYESRETTTQASGVSSEKRTYNSIEDVDQLIERLETSFQSTPVVSERANKILEERKKKIEFLKQLVLDAKRAQNEEKMIQQLVQENSELDDAINSFSRGFHK